MTHVGRANSRRTRASPRDTAGVGNGEGASGAGGDQVRGTLSSVPHRSVTADSPVRECAPALPSPVMRGESPSLAHAGPLAAGPSPQHSQCRDLATALLAKFPGGPAQRRPRHREAQSREYRVQVPPPRTTLPTPANANANRATMSRGRRDDSAAHGPPTVDQDPAAPSARASQATGPAAPPAADSRTTGPAGLCAPGLFSASRVSSETEPGNWGCHTRGLDSNPAPDCVRVHLGNPIPTLVALNRFTG